MQRAHNRILACLVASDEYDSIYKSATTLGVGYDCSGEQGLLLLITLPATGFNPDCSVSYPVVIEYISMMLPGVIIETSDNCYYQWQETQVQS